MRNKLFWFVPGLFVLLLSVLLVANGQKQSQVNHLKNDVKTLQEKEKAVDTQNITFKNQSADSYSWAKAKANNFAMTYYTWTNQDSYQARQKTLSSMLQLSSDNEKKIFDSGLDDTGGKKIDNLGLKSKVIESATYVGNISGSQVELFTVVKTQVDADGRDSASAYHLVHFWADKNSKKFNTVLINQLKV